MKTIKAHFVIIATLVFSIWSCTSDKKSKATESENPIKTEISASSIVFQGEFIHVDTAAVLKGSNFIYGVKMDEVSQQLISQVNEVKNDEYDVINVVVKGELSKNPAEGWEEIITITSIEKVYPPSQIQEEKVIKYSSKKTE